MDKKCICLVRVSTENQDLQQQTEEVVNMAKLHGYKKVNEDIILIENKESAVKLDEEQRQGLTEMKQKIEIDSSIDCLFVYEISRISRKAEVLFSIRNYCQTHKIQIIICKPSIMVFKNNWEVDESANIMFSIFSAMAENEGFLRKERMARGKKQAAKQGKNIGGIMPYGLKVNDENIIEENTEEADKVREIFNLMASGKYSSKTLWKEEKERGLEMPYRSFYNILKYEPYTGQTPKNHKFEKKLPIIIDKELFDKVQKILVSNCSTQSKESKHHYLGNKLVVCPQCGRHLVINKDTYKCVCNGEESPYIKTSVMDGILWNLAKYQEIVYLAADTQEKENQLNEEIKLLESKLNNAIESGASIEQRKENIITLFEFSRITEKQMNMRLEKAEQDDQDRQKQMAEYRNRIESLKQQLKAISNKENSFDIINKAFDIVEGVEVEKEMREIVKRHIYKVNATKGKENEEKFIKLEFEFANGKIETLKYYPYRRSSTQIEQMNNKGIFQENPLLDNPIYRENGKVFDLFTYNKGGINYNIEAERDKKRIEKAIKRNEQRETAK